jgi:Uma2 family endonuclease
MTQAKQRFATFEEYLACSDEFELEGLHELVDGELVELPPESGLNNAIANELAFLLAEGGIRRRLITPGKCEIQVPVLQKGDAANRYPDLVVFREEHVSLTQRRLTITMLMPPPVLVVEVVSPGKQSRDRDYERKRTQYERLGIPEYLLIDPQRQMVIVFHL